MGEALRISEVAGRAGVSAATVRYYERIGVLPAAVRSGNGYRAYDERTVERLEFVTRAKALGCTLDEISDLILAWEGGECGPVQDRLRRLVADKIDDAEREVANLRAFTDELRRAAVALESHRPVGPCDSDCGCIGDPDLVSDERLERTVALISKPTTGVCRPRHN